MGTRCRIALGLIAVLLVGIVPATSAHAMQAACGGAAGMRSAMVTYLYTFHVEAKPQKPSYPAGGTAKIDFVVTRPGDGDPLGEGQEMPRPMTFPAEGVEVNVSIYAGRYFYMYGSGTTDADGKATVPVKLHPKSPAGWARGEVSARAYYNRGGCPDAEEFGSQSYPQFFKITR
ncbi:MAG TPA: hypothetical protein VJ927_11515 [Actinomycetota bacterium]|nr:hypothetical protein [Actinomycetota bacterium]